MNFLNLAPHLLADENNNPGVPGHGAQLAQVGDVAAGPIFYTFDTDESVPTDGYPMRLVLSEDFRPPKMNR